MRDSLLSEKFEPVHKAPFRQAPDRFLSEKSISLKSSFKVKFLNRQMLKSATLEFCNKRIASFNDTFPIDPPHHLFPPISILQIIIKVTFQIHWSPDLCGIYVRTSIILTLLQSSKV